MKSAVYAAPLVDDRFWLTRTRMVHFIPISAECWAAYA